MPNPRVNKLDNEQDIRRFVEERWAALEQVRDGWPPADERTILAALYSPGFTHDHTNWQLTIDAEGIVRQVVDVFRSGKSIGNGVQRLEQRVGPHLLREVMRLADETGFARLAEKYGANCTDLETMSLAIRIGDRVKVVEAYGARWNAHRRRQQMVGFVRLWDCVHGYAPFRQPH